MQAKFVVSFRRWLARKLCTLINWLEDDLMGLADWVRGEPLVQPELPLEASMHVSALLAFVHNVREHPCPTCKAKGAVIVNGDDPVACPTCKGTKIDPAFIQRKAL